MFETSGTKFFVNRAHIGDYAKIEFDTYAIERGREEIYSVESSMHYYKTGSGEPLILVHGLGQSLYTFRDCLEVLGGRFTVYAIDLPAHGFSERPSISYNVEEIALCIESFMNALGLVSAHFCAFGESAAYVLDFSIHNAERAGNLIFVSPLISGDPRITPAFPLVSVSSRLILTKQSFYNELLSLFFDRTLLTPEVLDETFLPFCDKEFRQILKLFAGNYSDQELMKNIPGIRSHVLVVRGADDKVSPPLDEGIASFPIPGMKTYTVRNCNFLVQEEKADKLSEAIIEFCNLYKDRK